MLGVPNGLGSSGIACLLAGVLLAAVGALRFRQRFPADLVGRAAAFSLVVSLAAAPYLAWRIVEDLRVTTGMTAYDRSVAGPVQAYLQPYLLDPVGHIIPPGASYTTVVGRIAQPQAGKAFAALAMITLFPRRSPPNPRTAEWVVAWGASPRAAGPVGHVVVARPSQAGYPAVLVARRLP